LSQSEIERFVEALKNDPELHRTLTAKVSGLGLVVEIAQSLGYDSSLDEAKNHARSLSNITLADDQLEAIAGPGDWLAVPAAVATAELDAVEAEVRLIAVVLT